MSAMVPPSAVVRPVRVDEAKGGGMPGHGHGQQLLQHHPSSKRRPRPQSLQQHQPLMTGTEIVPARPAVAPHRLFIRDAILRQFAQDTRTGNNKMTSNATSSSSSSAGLYVRLMGVVVSSSSSPSARSRSGAANEENSFNCSLQQQGSSSSSSSKVIFVIDDGTASVEVVRQSPPSNATSSTVPIPMNNKRSRLDGENYVEGSINQTQTAAAVVGEMPRLGSLVDCVGYLTLPDAARAACAERNATNKSADGTNDRDEGQKDQEEEQEQAPLDAQSLETTAAAAEGEVPTCESASCSNRLPVLNAVSVAAMSNPDAESLRTLELLLSSSAATAENSEASSSEEDAYRSSNRNVTGIHIAGDLLSKIGAFQFRPTDVLSSIRSSVGGTDNNMKPPPQAQAPYVISSTTVFRLIKSAASDGGLAEDDLGIALGCHSGIDPNGTVRRGASSQYGDAGAAAVREVLQNLQFDGEIYMTGRGTYLPL